MHLRILVTAVCALCLAGCAGSSALDTGRQSAPLGFSLELPPARQAAALNLNPDGSAYLLSSAQGVSTDGTVAVLDAGEADLAWVMYGTDVPEGFELDSISIEFDQPDTEFWLAFSDYGGANAWELHGPYNADSPLPVGLVPEPAQAGKYLNDTPATYWAVIVARPHAVRVVSSHVSISAQPVFARPAAGDFQVDSASSLFPDLLLTSGDGGSGEAGSPLIAYTSLAAALPELHIAYFDGAGWQHKRIDAERNLAQPQIMQTAAGFRVIAQEPATGTFHDYLLDARLEVVGTDSFDGETGTPLFNVTADIYNFGTTEAPDEELLLAAAFSSDTHSEFWLMRWTESGGWEEEHAPIIVDDQLTGATLGFSPAGGWPVAAYSHGTFDTTDGLLIDTSMQVGFRAADNWLFLDQDVVIDSTNQAPLGLDIGFLEDGTPQLVAVAARDFSLVDFTSSLFLDVAIGSPGDESWFFERAFESDVKAELVIPPFPPEEAIVTLAVAPFAAWAMPDGLIHFRVDGEINIDIATQQPTGGNVSSSTEFRSKPFVTWVKDDYYTGDVGIQFSFGDYHIGGGTAYIKASALSIEDILAGTFALENELRYWSPD